MEKSRRTVTALVRYLKKLPSLVTSRTLANDEDAAQIIIEREEERFTQKPKATWKGLENTFFLQRQLYIALAVMGWCEGGRMCVTKSAQGTGCEADF